MKKKENKNITYKLPIKIIWFIHALLGFGGFIFLCIEKIHSPFIYLIFLFVLLYIALFIYITLRIFRFKRRLTNYFRRLISGNYSTGIHEVSWIHDEITLLTDMATKVAEHLDTYDRIRADRTALSLNALDILFKRASRKIIMADMDKSVFKFTKSLQESFGVNQESFSFNVIEKQKRNEHFFRQFMIAALKERQNTDFSATFELPIRESALDLDFKFVPIKDKTEKVRIAFLYVDFSENDPAD